MTEVVWSDEAFDQLDEIIAYIEQFDSIAAADMGVRLRALADSLHTSPNRGRPASNDARELVTVRPYIMRYSVHGDRVLIRNVRHSRRRPQG